MISDEDIMVERVGVIENGGVEFRDVMGPGDGVVVARVVIAEPNDGYKPQNEKKPYDDRCNIFTTGGG